jgi:integrase
MKSKALHRAPLSAQAAEIPRRHFGRRGKCALVFSTRRKTPLSDMVLTKLLRDAGIKSDTPGRTATAHGFRSAFRDWASESGYPTDVAERALAHTTKDSTEAAYHRTDLLEPRRMMMEAWGRLIEARS